MTSTCPGTVSCFRDESDERGEGLGQTEWPEVRDRHRVFGREEDLGRDVDGAEERLAERLVHGGRRCWNSI